MHFSTSLSMVLLMAASALGEVISYEGDSFPDDDPLWIRSIACEPQRWLDQGWLVQHIDECEAWPPPGGDLEAFRYFLIPFTGSDTFFVEWRVYADGDRSEIPGVAPAVMSVSGLFGVLYHFTIARDQVRVIRDSGLPIVWVDIDPDVPHTYRLELHGADLYAWFIDGELIDSGVPEGAYPTHEGDNVIWGGSSWFLENTIWWDYVRFGTIAADGSGDFDSDADVDLRDFGYFDECMANSGPGTDAGPGCRWADMDGDDDVDFADAAAFQRAFTGGDNE